MDIPWYGWLFSGCAFWLHAALTGYAWGKSHAFTALMAQQAKAMQMPGLPPGMPGPGGR